MLLTSNAANWVRKIDDFAILSTLSTRPWGKNIICARLRWHFGMCTTTEEQEKFGQMLVLDQHQGLMTPT